jgi:hypothetical protein
VDSIDSMILPQVHLECPVGRLKGRASIAASTTTPTPMGSHQSKLDPPTGSPLGAVRLYLKHLRHTGSSGTAVSRVKG